MTTPGFNVFNDQIFNTVTILNAIIIKGSLVTVGGIVFQNVPGNDLNVDLDRYFNNANAASIRFRTFIPGAPGAPVNDWVIGTIAGSYEFSIVQSTNATGASANMNITLNNAILVVTGQMRLTRSTAADQFFDIDRLNNTVNDFIRFTRASSSTVDWNIGTTAGGSVLAISQGAGGVNRDMTISLTDGLATTGTLILTGKLTAQIGSAAAGDQIVLFSRFDTTVNNFLRLGTGGAPIWQLGMASGGSVLALSQAGAGINQSFLMNLSDNATGAGTLTISGKLTVTMNAAGAGDEVILFNRPDTTVNNFLRFGTGGATIWQLGMASGGSVLALSQAGAGVNQSFNMNLSDNATGAGTLTLSGKLTVTINAAGAGDQIVLFNRPDTTVNNFFRLGTGGATIWQFAIASGGSVLALSQGGAGVGQNFTIGLGSGQLQVTAGTANSTQGVSSTTGYTVPGNAGGYKYSGTILVSGAGSPQTLNAHAGVVIFTGVTIIAGGNADFVINNTSVPAGAIIHAWLIGTLAANTSAPYVRSIGFTAGTSITVNIQNGGAGSTGSTNFNIGFQIIQ